jgi:hypothetical protein
MAALLFFTISTQAKIWRINNNFGASADFEQATTAISSPLVSPGDTLFLEGSGSNYQGGNLTKRLVLIGPGYLLSGTDGNPGLQANPNTATITLYIDSIASGSVLIGLSLTAHIDGGADNVRIERCLLSVGQWKSGQVMSNLRLNKCIIHSHRFTSYATENLEVTNCIFETAVNYMSGSNSLYRNNIFYNANVQISNAYLSNNIFYGSSLTALSCTIRYNIATSNTLPAGNNNINGVLPSSLFVGGNSRDGKLRLAAGSPAIGAGEPIGGITPDCGVFGTPDPYRLSGIPPIPSIYELTVPASVPSSASNMTITVSTRSNN